MGAEVGGGPPCHCCVTDGVRLRFTKPPGYTAGRAVLFSGAPLEWELGLLALRSPRFEIRVLGVPGGCSDSPVPMKCGRDEVLLECEEGTGDRRRRIGGSNNVGGVGAGGSCKEGGGCSTGSEIGGDDWMAGFDVR